MPQPTPPRPPASWQTAPVRKHPDYHLLQVHGRVEEIPDGRERMAGIAEMAATRGLTQG
jgi:hypothetical protein